MGIRDARQISNSRTLENIFDSAMKFILDTGLNKNFALYKSLDNVIVLIAFRNEMHQDKRMKNGFIAGLLLDITSNHQLSSTRYQEIAMARCHNKCTLIRFWILLSSHG